MNEFVNNHAENKENKEKGVQEHLEELQGYVTQCLGNGDTETRANMCETVTESVKRFFDERNILNKIVEGDIELSPHDYLTHRINIVYEGDDVWIIDLSSKQIPKTRTSDWIMQKLPNDNSKIREFLIETYNWWFKP